MHADLVLRAVSSVSTLAYLVRLTRSIERRFTEARTRARLEQVIAFRPPLVESRAWERGRI